MNIKFITSQLKIIMINDYNSFQFFRSLTETIDCEFLAT